MAWISPPWARFRPGRGGMDGWKNGQEFPMFYRTSSLLGPLPCFHSALYNKPLSRARVSLTTYCPGQLVPNVTWKYPVFDNLTQHTHL